MSGTIYWVGRDLAYKTGRSGLVSKALALSLIFRQNSFLKKFDDYKKWRDVVTYDNIEE